MVLATLSPGVGRLTGGLAYIGGEIIAIDSGGTSTAYRIDPTTGAVLGTLTLGGTGIVGGLAGDGVAAGSVSGGHLVRLAIGEVATGINFGNQFVPPGAIYGAKWNDVNGNGVWEQPDEPGLAGWTIFLDTNENGELDDDETWTITAADGSYSFAGLSAGEYVLAEVMQEGWAQTFAPPSITVEPGTNTLNVNFGNIALPPLPGDYNNNGAVDAADYVLWRMALGSMVGRYSGADGSGNGTIGPEDHGVWTANFGNVLPPETGDEASLVVALAEPAALEIDAPGVAEQRTDSSGALAVDFNLAPQRRAAASRQANREWRLESREPRRDVALMAWLAQATAVDEVDREAPDGDDIDEGSRDSYFQSFERAAGAVDDAARRKWFNGGWARLATLR
jgi:hypothetical protein